MELTSGGSGYTHDPVVVFKGGNLAEFDYPYSFVQDTRISLFADAYDIDGTIKEVRFYGNGKLLGAPPLGNVISLELVNPGTNFVNGAPTVTIVGPQWLQ